MIFKLLGRVAALGLLGVVLLLIILGASAAWWGFWLWFFAVHLFHAEPWPFFPTCFLLGLAASFVLG